MTDFTEVKDSGARQDFDTGARRDTQDDKPRYGLIPPYPLYRLAMHYTNGAKKYGENNWTKGMPMSRTWESLERHVQAYKEGDNSEDHLAAIAWNAFALMWYAERMPEMNDLAEYLCWPHGQVAVTEGYTQTPDQAQFADDRLRLLSTITPDDPRGL